MHLILRALWLSYFVKAANCWSHASRSDVEDLIKSQKAGLVAFVLPSNDACNSLDPEWSAAAESVDMPLLSIDCSVEKLTCEEHAVLSYPAIRFFSENAQGIRYRGARNSASILSFIRRSRVPSISTLDVSNITSFKGVDDAVFVVYPSNDLTSLESNFKIVAARNHLRYSFGIATDPRIAESEGVTLNSIVCYKWNDGQRKVLSDASNINEIEKFIATAVEPLISDLTRKSEIKLLKGGKSLVYIFANTEKERSELRTTFKPLAKKYEEYLAFVTVDAIEYGPAMAAGLGLKKSFPALAVYNPGFGQVFPYDQSLEVEPAGAEALIMEIVQGKRKPYAGEAIEESVRKHDEL